MSESSGEERNGSEAVLRTLAPALRQLEKSLRVWLDSPRRYPLELTAKASIEQYAADLHRQAEALEQDRPLLVVMLMGGTGVGKSTLLNALAGSDIALSSYARPTTKDPVVYFHESIKPDMLDPCLRECRLRPHNRPELLEKVLVDTPDIDSNDLENREILLKVLPVADVVLYVGSQEKYHDELGWELFLQQRRRRAFAFVLNKWDRCLHAGAQGLRPDEDWLRDLTNEGFQNPHLFRTCAQLWVEAAGGDGVPDDEQAKDGEGVRPEHLRGLPTARIPDALPEGEQFIELVRWLNTGLNAMEIEAIKARGITQLLIHVHKSLEAACPPDLEEIAERTRVRWERLLSDEAEATAEILLNTLEPYQSEIEHHFTVESQKRFRGMFAGYLGLVHRVKHASGSLRDFIPGLPRPSEKLDASASWDLASFTRACTGVAGERHLDARGRALSNRLLLEADQQGFPLELLTPAAEGIANLDWRQRFAQALVETLHQVEQQWSNPTGTRKVVQSSVIMAADWLPSLTLMATAIWFLYGYTLQEPKRPFDWGDFAILFFVVLVVLIILHIFVSMVLPMRWPIMRGEFHRRLERRLQADLEKTYTGIPGQVADSLQQERQHIEKLIGEAKEVSDWLKEREHSSAVAGLYGN
ncbi:MAG: GTPase [Gemmataceae bacterium]